MQGVVEIRVPPRSAGAKAPIVDQFGSGQVFGDVAVLADEPTANVDSETAERLLAIMDKLNDEAEAQAAVA